MINVAIVEDHQLTIDGICMALDNHPNFQIAGIANNGKQLFEQVNIESINLVLLDIEMPHVDGIETARILHERFPDIKLIVISMFNDRYTLKQLADSKINGYILKQNCRKTTLLEAMRKVMDGESYFDHEILAEMMNILREVRSEEKRVNMLTKRQLQIIELIARGYTSEEIAQQLNSSRSNITQHRTRIIEILNVKNATEAATFCVKKGIIRLD